jgi:hypothetical protein
VGLQFQLLLNAEAQLERHSALAVDKDIMAYRRHINQHQISRGLNRPLVLWELAILLFVHLMVSLCCTVCVWSDR